MLSRTNLSVLIPFAINDAPLKPCFIAEEPGTIAPGPVLSRNGFRLRGGLLANRNQVSSDLVGSDFGGSNFGAEVSTLSSFGAGRELLLLES